MEQTTTIPSCAEQRYQIRRADLPLSCPTPTMHAWDGHPKVYLDFKQNSEVKCPYCGAVYVLVDD